MVNWYLKDPLPRTIFNLEPRTYFIDTFQRRWSGPEIERMQALGMHLKVEEVERKVGAGSKLSVKQKKGSLP